MVATDSIKNTIYIKAKEHPVNPPELYASLLGSHFLDRYAHMNAANVTVVQHRWTRLSVDGKPHPHSFVRDSEETRNVSCRVSRDAGIEITSSIAKLTVLKSTGSAFYGFVRDEFTTLAETWDRILSTDVECSWRWKTFAAGPGALGEVEKAAAEGRFDNAWAKVREITIKTFAEDESASVQNTMYKMCEKILEAVPDVATVGYSLPNKHYFEIGKLDANGKDCNGPLADIDGFSLQTSAGTRASRTRARTLRSTLPKPIRTVSSSAKSRAPKGHGHLRLPA